MDRCRNKKYVKISKIIEEKVVKMTPITQTKPEKLTARKAKTGVDMVKQKKKRSALEISDAIGLYGAFGRTLSDLHKQGR